MMQRVFIIVGVILVRTHPGTHSINVTPSGFLMRGIHFSILMSPLSGLGNWAKLSGFQHEKFDLKARHCMGLYMQSYFTR